MPSYPLNCEEPDIAQREGRILRQGNQNEQVAIMRLVTERSFDSYMWQAVERKATFIAQLMRGSLDTREIEEIDSATLSAAEAKAISSGNPLLLEHSTLQAEVARLRRLERAHGRNESMLTHTRHRAEADVTRYGEEITGLEAAVERIIDTSGENFRMSLGARTFDSRIDAGHALAEWAHNSGLQWAPRHTGRSYGQIARIAGFTVSAATSPRLGGKPVVELSLDGVPRSRITIEQDIFLAGGVGLVQRLENRAVGIPILLEKARTDLAEAEHAVVDAAERIGRPFRCVSELAQVEADLARVEEQLAPTDDPAHQETADAEPAGRELDVEAVRAHQPALGVRSGDRARPAVEPIGYERPDGLPPAPRL